MIINMYAKGLSTRDIAETIEKMYGTKYSASSVSNLTDVALEEKLTYNGVLCIRLETL
nr:transposase [Anoxybacter fermentans]